jgi:hypothetical protein
MTTLRITIQDSILARELAKFLKTISYVKDVSIEKPLVRADWIKAGRPATVKEVDALLEEIEKGKGEYTTEQLRSELKKWQKRKTA